MFFRVEVCPPSAMLGASIGRIVPLGAGSSRSANCSAHDLGAFLFGIFCDSQSSKLCHGMFASQKSRS